MENTKMLLTGIGSAVIAWFIDLTVKTYIPKIGDKMFTYIIWIIFFTFMTVYAIIKAKNAILKQKREEIVGIKETFMSQADAINDRLDKFNKTLQNLDEQIQNSTKSLNENVMGYKDATIAAIGKPTTERSR